MAGPWARWSTASRQDSVLVINNSNKCNALQVQGQPDIVIVDRGTVRVCPVNNFFLLILVHFRAFERKIN